MLSKIILTLIFETLCFGRLETLLHVWKYYHKNERHLNLVAHIYTKLSQNMCLTNTLILWYRYARYDSKLWNASWFYCAFWVFSYTMGEPSCLEYCILSKLSQIVSLIIVHIFYISSCQMWLQVMEGSLF